jgi:hypothetical protein
MKKVTFSLCVNKHHATKTYRGMKVQHYLFFTSAQEGVKLSDSCGGRLISGGKHSGAGWIRGKLVPRTGLGAEEDEFVAMPGIEHRISIRLAHGPITVLSELLRSPGSLSKECPL